MIDYEKHKVLNKKTVNKISAKGQYISERIDEIIVSPKILMNQKL